MMHIYWIIILPFTSETTLMELTYLFLKLNYNIALQPFQRNSSSGRRVQNGKITVGNYSRVNYPFPEYEILLQ